MPIYSTHQKINDVVAKLIEVIETPNPYDPQRRCGTIAGIIEAVRIFHGDKAARGVRITVH